MVRYQLGENLDSIVGGDKGETLIFELIEWAETKGRVAELIRGTTTANPGNPDLQMWMDQHSSLLFDE